MFLNVGAVSYTNMAIY